MFGIGFLEITVILTIALIVLGPKRLPELAKALGKAYHEFQSAFSEVRDTIQNDIDDRDPPPKKDNPNDTDKP